MLWDVVLWSLVDGVWTSMAAWWLDESSVSQDDGDLNCCMAVEQIYGKLMMRMDFYGCVVVE